MTPTEIKTATTAQLVAFYNKITSKNIKKFQDRATAEKRCLELAPQSTQTLRPAGKPVSKGLPGPNSKLTGKRLFLKVEANPRRVGTLGHASFSIIKNGMTYEEYRLKGGRSNDLAWDIAHDYVEVR